MPNVPSHKLNSYFASLVSSTEGHSLEIPCGPAAETAMEVFDPVSVECVQHLLASLDAGKSCGPNNIKWLLKAANNCLASSITKLFNCSLRTGKSPTAFKLANITPILKAKQDPTLAESYRGMSLKSILSKVLEKVVRQQLFDFFPTEIFFTDQQYGFCTGRCCENLLVASVDQWQIAMDAGKVIATVCLDLSKAFDNVQHQTLLAFRPQ